MRSSQRVGLGLIRIWSSRDNLCWQMVWFGAIAFSPDGASWFVVI